MQNIPIVSDYYSIKGILLHPEAQITILQLKMAMEKGLLPSGINVNDPTYSSNQQLVHICRTLLSEIEKKSRLQMDLQQAYRGGRVSKLYKINLVHL